MNIFAVVTMSMSHQLRRQERPRMKKPFLLCSFVCSLSCLERMPPDTSSRCRLRNAVELCS